MVKILLLFKLPSGGNEGRGISGAENKDKDLLGSFTVELLTLI